MIGGCLEMILDAKGHIGVGEGDGIYLLLSGVRRGIAPQLVVRYE